LCRADVKSSRLYRYKPDTMCDITLQADNMTSREAVKQQYQSFQDYEEDFM